MAVMKPVPVLVEWDDSAHLVPGSWMGRAEASKTGVCGILTVGWLIGEDEKCITIAQSISEADDVTGAFVIPRTVVRRVKRLRGFK